MKAILFSLCLLSSVTTLFAHDDHGGRSETTEVGAELFIGRRGYIHSGAEVSFPLSESQTIGIVGHVVREDSDGEWFPSLGGSYLQEFADGLFLKIHLFGYTPVEDESAIAGGFRFSKEFEIAEGTKLTAFAGSTYAHVQAAGELGSEDVSHLMGIAGLTLDYRQLEVGIFGTGSFYDQNPGGLETHVDLQEMTQLSAYENNDGFPDQTVGAQIGYRLNSYIKLSANYTGMFFKDEVRHSYSVISSVQVSPRIELKAGFQMLRDGESENDMLVLGTAITF